MGIRMVFFRLLLKKEFVGKKIYTFLVPEGTIFHYGYVAGLRISSVGQPVCS